MNKDKILVVVDMQNDFITGSLGTPEAQAIVPKVVDKIREWDSVILATMDTHGADYLDTQEGKNLPVEHCMHRTEGQFIVEEVSDLLWDKTQIFPKNTFGSVNLACGINDLYKEGYVEVVLIGVCTDICVISNALLIKAFCPEIKITVDATCCAGVTPDSHKNALEAMKMCQINIVGEDE